jgi:hypothetical protein
MDKISMYVWLTSKKENGTGTSKILWCGKSTVERMRKVVDSVKYEDVLKMLNSRFFSGPEFKKSISIQEMGGETKYRRTF